MKRASFLIFFTIIFLASCAPALDIVTVDARPSEYRVAAEQQDGYNTFSVTAADSQAFNQITVRFEPTDAEGIGISEDERCDLIETDVLCIVRDELEKWSINVVGNFSADVRVLLDGSLLSYRSRYP